MIPCCLSVCLSAYMSLSKLLFFVLFCFVPLPERLGAAFIINAPSVLSFAWRIIQGFLDKVTKEKIHIMSAASEWMPVLKVRIGGLRK